MQNYKYTPPSYKIPAGNHRAKITAAAWDFTKSGREKILFTLKISGQKNNIKYSFVFCTENQQALDRTNYYLKKFCDAFALNPEDLNSDNFSLNNWLGAEGGIVIDYEDDNPYPQIKKFLTRKQLDFLPPFSDGPRQQYIQQPFQTPQTQQATQQYTQQQNFYTQQQDTQQQGGYFSPNADPSKQIPF